MLLYADASSEVHAHHVSASDYRHRLHTNRLNAVLHSVYLAFQPRQVRVHLSAFGLRSWSRPDVGDARLVNWHVRVLHW